MHHDKVADQETNLIVELISNTEEISEENATNSLKPDSYEPADHPSVKEKPNRDLGEIDVSQEKVVCKGSNVLSCEVASSTRSLNNVVKLKTPSIYRVPKSQPLPSGVKRKIPISNCCGRKKAVIVGINYTGTGNQLRGCINDANNMAVFIKTHYGFTTNGTVVLTDDGRGDGLPTKANILQAMRWLVEDAGPNDSLFFHFSGHGDQIKDLDGDEEDGKDEIILPLDYKTQGIIVDDEMHDIMVRPLPPGSRLTAVFDCCHSGSALDLPYLYNDKGLLTKVSPEFNFKALSLKKAFLRSIINPFTTKKTVLEKEDDFAQSSHPVLPNAGKASLADVIMFSSCKDGEKSADAVSTRNINTGVLTYAFIDALSKNPYKTSYNELLSQIRCLIVDKFSQVPQLSSGRPMDMDAFFNI